MSVTFSGGITFTGGGFSFTAAPPAAPTAGWFSGGQQLPSYGAVTTVDRITFATDTATASVRGPIAQPRRFHSATGTFTYGYHGGGQYSGATPSGYSTSIDRIIYASDTATASTRGTLDATRYQSAATSSDSYGYFGAGYTTTGSKQNTISRIDYSNDTATATNRGPLPLAIYKVAATSDTTTYGWFGGGSVFPAAPRPISSVSRITYANDTATASARGPLASARYDLSATGNSSYGWYVGGDTFSAVDRITYATDTATASVRGPLTRFVYAFAGVGDNDYGLYGGGKPPPASTVDRITYANDTVTASTRGPMAAATYVWAASSGVQ